MSDETIGDAVEAAAVERDGKRVLYCARAFEIAAGRGVAVRAIGEACNDRGVKIVGCQLGCFD
ncbi:MAG: hypothetical protein JW876_04380 [Candidatus Krumholzibacteriota bacterium]|nr:hypothetical protein [Candidatus Krumholzibacteriota bacterium]